MKKALNKNKILVFTLACLLIITCLSSIPTTQAFDSYIAVYPTTDGCQSITITDNTNSSYTDTFTTADMFEFDAIDSLTFSAEAQEGYVFAYWRFDNPGGGGGYYDNVNNPYTVPGAWVNNYEAVIAYFVVPSISVSLDSPTSIWYS
ncbi:MAG: hypothetical protein WC325_12825, partial [Candidatus Bathyarchaeia archaeon]